MHGGGDAADGAERRIPTPIAQRLSGIVTGYRTLQLLLGEITAEAYESGLRGRDPLELKDVVYPLERAFEVASNYVVELVGLGLRELGVDTQDGPADIAAFAGEGVITQRLARQLADIHRARNELTHAYPDLRASVIYEACELQVKVIPTFLRSYARWLRSRGYAAPEA